MRDAPGIIAWDRNSSLCQVMRLGSLVKAEVGSGSVLPASGAGAERQACQRGR